MDEPKKCPPWAKSVVDNYRQFFKEKLGRETKLSDDAIWTIRENVGVLGDLSETDAAIVADMLYAETE